ncbi:MAG: hypothetical protein WKF77_11870, partial [Planctomycetaceae bacterium]
KGAPHYWFLTPFTIRQLIRRKPESAASRNFTGETQKSPERFDVRAVKSFRTPDKTCVSCDVCGS